MLYRVEPDQSLCVPTNHSLGGDHLAVEPGALRQRPMESAAMPVRPVHHRRHSECFLVILKHLTQLYQRIRCELVRLKPPNYAPVRCASAHGVRVDPTTFGHLIDLHIDDLKDVGKAPRR
jgi:hypothetical protein